MTAGKVLLLGNTGKLGLAVTKAFAGDYVVVGRSRPAFDAVDLGQVARVVTEERYDIVVNAVACTGVDECERAPQQAFAVNSLLPGMLAQLSRERGFLLVHFSTEAVFGDREEGEFVETDCPAPPNIYGLTKLGGDYLIQAHAERYYVIRISLQFGESLRNAQFVEKMLRRVGEGQKTLAIAADVICSPSYSLDVARRVRRLVEERAPYGVYHVANAGRASLYDLMREIVGQLGLDVEVRKASHRDFPSRGKKNTSTPLGSRKIDPLRPWQEAVREYCAGLQRSPRPPWARQA